MRKSLVISVTLMLLAACTKGPPPNTLFIHLGTEPPSLDPSRIESVVESKVLQNILEPLLEYDESLALHGATASSWNISEDGLTYTFNIEANRVWSDGQPLYAEHYRYSILRTLNPDVPSKLGYLLYPIKNAKDYKMGRIKNSAQVGVKAPDPFTLVITLEKPSVEFVHAFASPITLPQREDIVENFGETYGSEANIPSCGPFKLTEWKHDKSVLLTRNESYSGYPRPKIDRIEARIVSEGTTAVALFETGQIHILEQLTSEAIERFRNDPRMKVYPDFSTYFIGFNTRKKPFDDKRVRQAFSLAVNKDQITNILRGDQPGAYSFVPPGIAGYNPAIGLRYNPELAKKLLAQAGYPDGKGFPKVAFGFNNGERHKQIAEWLQQQWHANLGVDVTLNNEEWKVYLRNLVLAPSQLYRFAWQLIFPDPLSALVMWQHDNPNNYTGWHSKEYDTLVDQIATSPKDSQRMALVDKAQRILVEQEVPFIPIYFYARHILVNPIVSGFKANGLGVLSYKYLHLNSKEKK